MRLKIVILSIIISSCSLVLMSCNPRNKTNSPNSIVSDLMESLTLEQSQPEAKDYAYEIFQNLFNENSLENANKDLFKSLKNVVGSSSNTTHTLVLPIKLENGKGILAYLSFDEKNGLKIENIMTVSNEVINQILPE